MKQPNVKVGIIENEEKVKIFLPEEGVLRIKNDTISLLPGNYEITAGQNKILIVYLENKKYCIELEHGDITILLKNDKAKIKVFDVKIGRQFHWERYQQHEFYGELLIKYSAQKKFTVINIVPVEQYLVSVISSEMSSSANIEYLKAHAVISRSWVIRRVLGEEPISDFEQVENNKIVKWYGQKGHLDFDICNDDHCQRYHGFSKISDKAQQAVVETKGQVLMYQDKICNTVFYKTCGGITELYSTCWEDKDFNYLQPVWDNIPQRPLPDLSNEKNLREFIDSSPDVFCNTSVKDIEEYLTDFDKETTDFFRWSVRYKNSYLSELIETKTGKKIGKILALNPLSRGVSGRIKFLEIKGSQNTIVVGKELQIRKVLAESHLYSSCFYTYFDGDDVVIKGAGWGHGVGLCQIGAAVMAKRGYSYTQILYHYYPQSKLVTLY